MANTQRRDDEPTRSRRVRGALAPLGRASAAATACILWVGLAMPGLQLLPGAGGYGDRSIAISLQSALLGIDNGYASTPEVRAAMRALGLAVISQSPGPQLQTDGPVSLAVDLAESIRADTVDTTVTPTLVSDGPHNRPSAGTDAPVGTPPSHEHPDAPDAPAAPAEPSAPTPPPGGGVTPPKPPKPPKPPSAPTKSPQSISFNTSPWAAVVGGSYAVGAAASSGLPVSFSLAPGSSSVCTISGATVSFVGPGTCTVRANQSGNASYLPAPQVTQSIDVDDAVAVQTISFVSKPPSGAHVHDPPYTVNAKATSGLPVEFGTEDESAGICKVTGVKVHLIGEGTCTINATQRGNSKFKPAPPVLQSFSIGTDGVSQSVQSINFTSTPPTAPAVGGTYVVAATASSGLTVAFSAAPSSAGVCTVAGSTVSLVGTGTCTVRANQAGNASYLAAPQVQQGFLVGLVGQTITFSSTPPSGAAVGGPAYTVIGDVLVRPPRRLQREPEQRLRLHRLRLDGLVDGCRDLHGRRRPARRRDARSGAAGPAVVHDRRPTGAERPVDQLHLRAALVLGRRRCRVRRCRHRRAQGLPSPSRSRPRAPASAPSPARRSPPSASGPAPSVRTRRATRATRRRRRSGSRSRSVSRRRRPASRHRRRRAQRWAIPTTPSAHPRPPASLSLSRPPLRVPGSAPCRAPPSPSSPQERAP